MHAYYGEREGAGREANAMSSAITAAALTYVEPGLSMVFGHGRLGLALASALSDTPYHILTPSIEIIRCLSARHHIRLTLPGGTLFHDRGIIVSRYDDPILRHFVASRAFVSAEGLSADGVLLSDPVVVQATRHLLDRTMDIVVLADSRTFRVSATLSACPLSRISALIIDSGVSTETLRTLTRAGIRVHLVA